MMRMLKEYLRQIWKTAVLYLVFGGIFAGILLLYGIHPEPVLYALALCGFIGIVCFLFGFWSFREKQKAFLELERNLDVIRTGGASFLPGGSLEDQYKRLIQELEDEFRSLDRERRRDYEEMKDYYTMWAHQIKTPIAAMRLLLREQEGGEAELLKTELFKVEQYVEMALGYVRAEHISSDLAVERCSLDEIIRGAVRKYARLFIMEKISLDYEPVEEEVLTDRKWLSFVLEQILSNAVKYTRKGTVSIYMDSEQEKTLVIQDTGMGIRKEDLPRVFERGFTGCNGREEQHSTGIGLYSARRIMDKLGHKIRIESEEGEGTRVFLDLSRKELELL